MNEFLTAFKDELGVGPEGIVKAVGKFGTINFHVKRNFNQVVFSKLVCKCRHIRRQTNCR